LTRLVTRPIPLRASLSLEQAGVHPLLARLYAARGIATAEELDTQLQALLPPEALLGADAAAILLADAIAAGKRLLIVADYDCDGATACAVGLRALRQFGATVDYLVPNRFDTGYGLSPEVVALAAERRPDLIITVDNGIASVEGVAAANRLGITTLITDHHLPGPELPDAAVIVNPNQPGCDFPSKALAGVGVMFYVMLALRAELRRRGAFSARPEPNLARLLDLVALDPARAMNIASQLDGINRERRAIEADMRDTAEQLLASLDADACASLTLFDPDWHQGVIGILAGRVKDRMHRPTFAFARGHEGQVKGSGRSRSRPDPDPGHRRPPGKRLPQPGHRPAAAGRDLGPGPAGAPVRGCLRGGKPAPAQGQAPEVDPAPGSQPHRGHPLQLP